MKNVTMFRGLPPYRRFDMSTAPAVRAGIARGRRDAYLSIARGATDRARAAAANYAREQHRIYLEEIASMRSAIQRQVELAQAEREQAAWWAHLDSQLAQFDANSAYAEDPL